MFTSQYITVMPYPKANNLEEMTCYFYTGGVLFMTNIIIAKIIVFLDFMK